MDDLDERITDGSSARVEDPLHAHRGGTAARAGHVSGTSATDPRDGFDRRGFIRVLGGSAAVVGVTACRPDGNDVMDARTRQQSTAASSSGVETVEVPSVTPTAGGVFDGDQRAASIVPRLVPGADLENADEAEAHTSAPPEVPPPIDRPDQRIVEFSLEVIESECPIDPDGGVTTTMWGFRVVGDADAECGTPGPVLRARVGDLIRIEVTNSADNVTLHSVEFHAITGERGGAGALTLDVGETAEIAGRLLYPGAFLYHGAFGDVPMHVAHGLYGVFIVDPEDPLPTVDHEWCVVQSEWYVGQPDDEGVARFDAEAMLAGHPRYVTFNGATTALTGDNSLQMAAGERARVYMVNAGLNLNSNFHAIGTPWDAVYPEAATHPANAVVRGSQSTLVVAGGGTVTELVGHVPSTIVLVDHALPRTFGKGCIGMVEVTGEDTSIFSSDVQALVAPSAQDSVTAGTGEPVEVVITPGAWDPANADLAYTPPVVTVSAGSRVVWRNTDSMPHTVTSGTTTGQAGTADGTFDSGGIQPGEEYEHTFTDPGTFDYFCMPHPWMKGQVVVTS